MNKPNNLSNSAAPFARLAEPSELAYTIAGTVEHELAKAHTLPVTVTQWARVIEPDVKEMVKQMERAENTIAYLIGVCQVNGIDAETMRKAHEMWKGREGEV